MMVVVAAKGKEDDAADRVGKGLGTKLAGGFP